MHLYSLFDWTQTGLGRLSFCKRCILKGRDTFIFHRQHETADFNKWKRLCGMIIISSIHPPIFFFLYVCLCLCLSVRLLVYLLNSQPFCQSEWLAVLQYASMYLFITVFILTNEIFGTISRSDYYFFSDNCLEKIVFICPIDSTRPIIIIS